MCRHFATATGSRPTLDPNSTIEIRDTQVEGHASAYARDIVDRTRLQFIAVLVIGNSVPPIVTNECIFAALAVEPVVAGASVQEVVATSAKKLIVATVARGGVVANPAPDAIIPAAAIDSVVALLAENDVIARTAHDPIVARAPWMVASIFIDSLR
jgi:hypothetical protein